MNGFNFLKDCFLFGKINSFSGFLKYKQSLICDFINFLILGTLLNESLRSMILK